MRQLILLTRNGCHLCETMKSVVKSVQRDYPVELTEIDITTRSDLEHRYRNEVPVLLLDKTVVAKYRVSASQLLAKLTST